MEKSGEGDVAVKGSDNPRNAAQFSYRLARKGGKECMLRHSGWVAIRPARKSGVVIGSGLAVNGVEVGTPFRHALAASLGRSRSQITYANNSV